MASPAVQLFENLFYATEETAHGIAGSFASLNSHNSSRTPQVQLLRVGSRIWQHHRDEDRSSFRRRFGTNDKNAAKTYVPTESRSMTLFSFNISPAG